MHRSGSAGRHYATCRFETVCELFPRPDSISFAFGNVSSDCANRQYALYGPSLIPIRLRLSLDARCFEIKRLMKFFVGSEANSTLKSGSLAAESQRRARKNVHLRDLVGRPRLGFGSRVQCFFYYYTICAVCFRHAPLSLTLVVGAGLRVTYMYMLISVGTLKKEPKEKKQTATV